MPTPSSIRLADLLLPREHGGWSIVLEPVALGLLAAPSIAGTSLTVAVLALFLARRPFRLSRDERGEPSRRRLAARVVFALTALAIAAGFAAAWRAGFGSLWPLLLTLPPAAAFVYFDSQGEARAAAAELAGTSAFALLPLAFGTLAALPPLAAAGLAAAMLVRLVPTVIVLRTYLRGQKGRPTSPGLALSASLAGVALAAVLAAKSIAPSATPAVAIVLLVRAAWLLGPFPPRLRASLLGSLESALGAGAVCALAFS